MSAKTTTLPAALLCVAFLVLGACTPQTKIGASWRDPDYTKGRIKKVLVIGIAAKNERRALTLPQELLLLKLMVL